jgi:hypothetical protein
MTWSTIASATAVSATFAASLFVGEPTVHVYFAGVGSMFSAPSYPRTSKVCVPLDRLP